MEHINLELLHQRFRAQGVSDRQHIAFVCPICETVQSIASLLKVGVSPEKVENYIGFSCEGRWTNAGPAASPQNKTKSADQRRAMRGCDWTLGGLFRLHTLEVHLADGTAQPTFQPASPEQAQALEKLMTAVAA